MYTYSLDVIDMLGLSSRAVLFSADLPCKPQTQGLAGTKACRFCKDAWAMLRNMGIALTVFNGGLMVFDGD